MNIKKGDVLKGKGATPDSKILSIIDNLYFLESYEDANFGACFFTLEGIKETFELPEEKPVERIYVKCDCKHHDNLQA